MKLELLLLAYTHTAFCFPVSLETGGDRVLALTRLHGYTQQNAAPLEMEQGTQHNAVPLDMERDTQDNPAPLDMEQDTQHNAVPLDMERDTQDNPAPLDSGELLLSKRSLFSFFDGIQAGIGGILSGVTKLATDPVKAVENLGYAILHPAKTFRAVKESFSGNGCGDAAHCAGKSTVMALGAALGVGGGAALTAAGASASAVFGLGAFTTINGISTANGYAEKARIAGGPAVTAPRASAATVTAPRASAETVTAPRASAETVSGLGAVSTTNRYAEKARLASGRAGESAWDLAAGRQIHAAALHRPVSSRSRRLQTSGWTGKIEATGRAIQDAQNTAFSW